MWFACFVATEPAIRSFFVFYLLFVRDLGGAVMLIIVIGDGVKNLRIFS